MPDERPGHDMARQKVATKDTLSEPIVCLLSSGAVGEESKRNVGSPGRHQSGAAEDPRGQ